MPPPPPKWKYVPPPLDVDFHQVGLTIARCISALFDITIYSALFCLCPPPPPNQMKIRSAALALALVCRQNTNIEKIYTMRASERERKLSHFHIINKCYFFQYFIDIAIHHCWHCHWYIHQKFCPSWDKIHVHNRPIACLLLRGASLTFYSDFFSQWSRGWLKKSE